MYKIFKASASPGFGQHIIPSLEPEIIYAVCKNSVRTSKRTPHFTIANINWLMLFKDIIAA